MRLINKKLALSLAFGLVGVAFGLLLPGRTYALGGTITTPTGTTLTLSTDNVSFVNPFTINASGVTFKTKTTACDNDNMYVCASGDVMHPGDYWYWPTSDGGASNQQTNGTCASALVLAVRQTPGGTGLNQSDLYIITAHPKVSAQGGGGCYVADDSGSAISQQDIEGWGAEAVLDRSVHSHSTYTIVKSSDVKTLNTSNQAANKSVFGALATEFAWVNSSEIDNVMGGGSGPSLRKSMKVTDSTALNTITTQLAHDDGSTKPYASGYDYFFPSDCVNSKNQILALLAVKQSDPSQVSIIHRQNGDGSQGWRADSWQGDQQSCLYGENHWNSPNRMWDGGRGDVTIVMADVQNAKVAAGTTSGGGTTDTGGTSGAADTELDCGGGAMNWIVCPVITIAQGAAEKLDGIISQMLTANIKQTFDSHYFIAWNSFRILATGLIVVAGLVMVASQAFGFEFLDAYTIRKTLPRLLIAIIGMSLSWPLMKFVVGFFNTFGADIYGLIVGPFTGIDAKINPGIGALTTVLAPVAGIGAIFIFGPSALLILVSGLLGLLMAFVILLIRLIGIEAVVILAPIAIACYTLPNTQKIWKLWLDNFLGLMMMYPIVMAFIGAGHAFATVSIQTGGSMSQIIGIIAYFIPYFLLPLAFRMATGVIGTISGMVNDRGKGIFDRMKGIRQNAASQRHTARMNDQLSTGRVGSIYRRLGSAGTPNSGALSLTRQGRANYDAFRQQHLQNVVAESLKNDNGRAAGDDNATRLATSGLNRSRFLQEYAALDGQNEASAASALALLERGFGAQMGSDAMQVAAFKARAGSSTAYAGSEDGTAMRFNEGARLVQHGLMSAADATAAGKGNRGRLDISGNGFGAQMTQFQAIADRGTDMTAAEASTYLDATLGSADPGDLLAGNNRTIEAMAPAMMRRLNGAIADRDASVARGDTTETVARHNQAVNRALGQVAGVQDNLNRTSPDKAALFANMVNGVRLPDSMGGITVRAAVERASMAPADPTTGIQDFLEVRKEYGSARGAAAAGALDPPATPEA